MTSVEAFKKLLLKVNKNDTNTDIDISKGEFVLLYNEQRLRWLKQKIDQNEDNRDAQNLADIQVKFKELTKVTEGDTYTTFSLPNNFFDYISSYSIASDAICKGLRIYNYPIKPANENMLLEDTNNTPSLEFEETIVDLSEGLLFVYKDKFSVDKVFLNYYREPIAIDIHGYIKLDGSNSTTVNPDLADVYVDEVLDRCALEIIRRYENPDGFQLAQNRLTEEK